MSPVCHQSNLEALFITLEKTQWTSRVAAGGSAAELDASITANGWGSHYVCIDSIPHSLYYLSHKLSLLLFSPVPISLYITFWLFLRTLSIYRKITIKQLASWWILEDCFDRISVFLGESFGTAAHVWLHRIHRSWQPLHTILLANSSFAFYNCNTQVVLF